MWSLTARPSSRPSNWFTGCGGAGYIYICHVRSMARLCREAQATITLEAFAGLRRTWNNLKYINVVMFKWISFYYINIQIWYEIITYFIFIKFNSLVKFLKEKLCLWKSTSPCSRPNLRFHRPNAISMVTLVLVRALLKSIFCGVSGSCMVSWQLCCKHTCIQKWGIKFFLNIYILIKCETSYMCLNRNI